MASGQHEQKNKEAEEQPTKPKFKRLMIEFENLTFIIQEFVRVRREYKSSMKYNGGIEYMIEIYMSSHPYVEKFSYETREARDTAYELLKMKLQDCGIAFELAKPTELLETETTE